MLLVGLLDTAALPPKVDTETFTAYRKEKLRRITRAEPFRLACGAELLLHHMAAVAGFPLDGDTVILVSENGKPYLQNKAFSFNLSHSGRYCVCAIADFEIGADIQQVTASRETVLRRYFTEEEAALIAASDRADIAFTELWARKEARVKLNGDTVFHLNRYSAEENAQTFTRLFRREDYCIAVAGERDISAEPVDYTADILKAVSILE